MKPFKTMLVVALLALWLPATNHCRLELIPGLAFLICCEHDEEEKTTGHHEDDCATDGCATVEYSLYKAETHRVVVDGPFTQLPAAVPAEFIVPVQAAGMPPEPAPPEISRAWQFACRAAAPPRAPSLAS